jgi:cobaltochelatase CobN
MHLLVRGEASLDETAQAEDLNLSPADLVLLSFSDSDLTTMAAAWKTWADDGAKRPTLRLANLARLRHPMSVDLFVEKTIISAHAVLVRLLGGIEYWRYGVEELARTCRAHGVALALVAGDGRPDGRLAALSTLVATDLDAIEGLLEVGGPANARAALAFLAARARGSDVAAPAAVPLPVCGVYRRPTGRGTPVTVVFYRSYLLAGDTAPIDVLTEALADRGLDPEALYVPSLKEDGAATFVRDRINAHRPRVIINATAFSAIRDYGHGSPLEAGDCAILQVVMAGCSRTAWATSARGLGPNDLAMHVVLPEADGRILAGAISFKEPAVPIAELEFAATLHRPAEDLIADAANLAAGWARLAARPRASRCLALVLSTYPGRPDQVAHAVGLDGPASALAILQCLRRAGYNLTELPETSAALVDWLTTAQKHVRWPLIEYEAAFAQLPEDFRQAVIEAWGPAVADPSVKEGALLLPIVPIGAVLIALQPERGEPSERKAAYHDAKIPPRHSYVAFYLWLRQIARIDALIHLGAHGTLEWLPGKAVALSDGCAPRVLICGTPVIYPFIVNDPGEAAQAKRRIGAVTIGHMTPALVTTELDSRLKDLERLIDEFSSADGLDARRRKVLAREIVSAAELAGLSDDLALKPDISTADAIARIDGFLCDLKELAIRDGLHVFGATQGVPDPAVAACGPAEVAALLAALDGRFVAPGPSGAPSRGRRDVLPTGRNLITIDPRAVPTRTALIHGRNAADAIIARYREDRGEWPRAIVIDLWGSTTIRTGGEELAAALNLVGVRPIWDHASFRVSGLEVMAPAELGRPRVDVTLRISGLFRDMFPMQLALFHAAVERVAALSEDDDTNPIAAEVRRIGVPLDRVFGAAPGSYGAGVSELIDRDQWQERADLGRAYLAATSTAYRGEAASMDASELFSGRLAAADAFVHFHDHKEADILSSADYAAHEGGAIAAATAMGRADMVGYHVDTADPGRPKARTIAEEGARIVLGRATSPRWIKGQMRHGFRGAAEIAATVDNAYAFAATAGAVTSMHFDRLYQAYLGDAAVAAFIEAANPAAEAAMRQRFRQALERGLWRPRLNSAMTFLNRELSE